MPRPPLVIIVVTLVLILSAARPAPGLQRNSPRSTARMLVDLARDQGLMRRGRQRPADVRQIAALLDAAILVDPAAPDAYIWQYELAALRGDSASAFNALDRLLEIDPENAGVREQWLEAGVSQAQDIEARRAWLNAQLKQDSISPKLRALIRTRLARLELLRMDSDAARIQLDRAIAIDENLADVAFLRLELLSEDAPPHVRIRAALAVLRVNPFQVELSWSVARLLAQRGFAEQAFKFHVFALEVNQAANPGSMVPPTRVLDLAHLEAARGALADAEYLARKALETDPALWQAQFYLHWLLRSQGERDQAAALVKQLAEVFAQITDPKKRSVEDVAQAAWFYCTLKPTPKRALMLAQAAAAVAPGDPFVVRVLGWAQALNGQKDEATATLLPIAANDPDAAYQLALLSKQSGDTAAIARLLDNLAEMPLAGPARDRWASLPVSLPASEPPERRHAEIADMLDAFDMELLELHKEAGRFLHVEAAFENPAPVLGEPWWVGFTLENKARFPITLGPDRMVNPVFLLSFDLQDAKRHSFPHLFTVSLDRKRVLLPGESVSIRQTIDIGPLRRQSRRTPQRLLNVTMNVLFDPQRDPQGRWSASISGQELSPIILNRVPVETGPGGIRSLLAAMASDSKSGRFGAIETLAALLGERQRANLHRLDYRPAPVPAAKIARALVKSLSGGGWETRVRVLDAMQTLGFDRKTLDAVRANLRHPHWLVRMMAVRLLGERQGRPFLGMARRIAEQDDHELVRAMAAGYVEQWQAETPTSRPAAAP